LYLLNNIANEKNIKIFSNLLLFQLPRKSSLSAVKNMCIVTGKSRGIYSAFQLSRLKIRSLSNMGFIGGLKKSS
jgi:ribosomal protein S14